MLGVRERQILANVNDATTSDSAASVTSDALTMVVNSMRVLLVTGRRRQLARGSSNRAGGAGGYDIYLAERACP